MNVIEIKSMNVFIELNGLKTFVIGEAASGKTYLLKKIMNKINNEDIFIDGKNIKEYDLDYLKNNIAVVLNDNNFKCEYVSDELNYYLNKLHKEVNITKLIQYFKIENLIDKEIAFLKLEDKMYVKIISLLIINPSIICIDTLYEYLNKKQIVLIDNYLKENNISLINVINNMEYLDLDSKLVILNNKNAIYCGDTLYALRGNSILPYMGFKLPFIIDLSQNLVLYNLLPKVEDSKEKVVDYIWK